VSSQTTVDTAPLRALKRRRVLVQLACLAVTGFMLVPVYLIALAAMSSRRSLNEFPLSLLPTSFSLDTLRTFVGSTGVLQALGNSLAVGLLTLVVSLLVGAPAGYAIARYTFRGRDAYQLFLLFTRALPIVVLSVPLAQLFLSARVHDTILGVTLLHTALALPTTILITASVFLAVPYDVEEAAKVFGCTPLQAFAKVVFPMALPGIAAASIFTFVLGAAILTFDHRTLPAQVLTALETSPLAFRFAGGFALIIPALIFIAVMRKYLLNMWGSTIR
jgi:multiple sugar transport system permease protein